MDPYGYYPAPGQYPYGYYPAPGQYPYTAAFIPPLPEYPEIAHVEIPPPPPPGGPSVTFAEDQPISSAQPERIEDDLSPSYSPEDPMVTEFEAFEPVDPLENLISLPESLVARAEEAASKPPSSHFLTSIHQKYPPPGQSCYGKLQFDSSMKALLPPQMSSREKYLDSSIDACRELAVGALGVVRAISLEPEHTDCHIDPLVKMLGAVVAKANQARRVARLMTLPALTTSDCETFLDDSSNALTPGQMLGTEANKILQTFIKEKVEAVAYVAAAPPQPKTFPKSPPTPFQPSRRPPYQPQKSSLKSPRSKSPAHDGRQSPYGGQQPFHSNSSGARASNARGQHRGRSLKRGARYLKK